jgi:sialic acid synthase SpsE
VVSGSDGEMIGDINLYCPRGYPTPPEAVHLPRFTGQPYVGLSSHCLVPELPIAAVARGCKLIEMHFMLKEEPSLLESNVSLDQYQFQAMVGRVRRAEVLLDPA